MNAGDQADPAVGRRLVVDAEIPVRDLDEQRLQEFAGIGERHAAGQHELHQRTQGMDQCLDKRARWSGVGGWGLVVHGAKGRDQTALCGKLSHKSLPTAVAAVYHLAWVNFPRNFQMEIDMDNLRRSALASILAVALGTLAGT